MTKYRLRLKNARVIGPFILSQLQELKANGRIQGDEEAQIFPTGDWSPIASFDFYAELMDQNKTIVTNKEPKEETFVIDLTKLRNQQNEIEIAKIDKEVHEPVIELTETIQLKSQQSNSASTHTNFELALDQAAKAKPKEPEKKAVVEEIPAELEIEDEEEIDEDIGNKTTLNPVAQHDLERIRKNKQSEEARQKAEEEQKRIDDEEKKKADEVQRLIDADESTQMIQIDRSQLMLVAKEEEVKIELEEKAIKKKKKQQEKAERDAEEEEDSENESDDKKKKVKIVVGLAIAAIIYALMFPSEEKPKRPPFKHVDPIVEFPVPFDKSDLKKAKIDFDKGSALFKAGDYVSIIKAGRLFKTSYENNIDSEEAVSLLVRAYAEQLKYSREDKQGNAQVIFNLIQAKRPFLAKNPDGVIGLNLFY
ncbi:MAG: hypothetical protein H0V66_02220, partial [Bdellovibrionales bacterium]|nr:hypothetical protein [Bdellovibrionales bacterium]